MSATRTQVYFTESQRQALDERAAAEGKSLAQVVREAVDAYLAEERPNGTATTEAAREVFGSIPDLETPPRREWDRDGRWADR